MIGPWIAIALYVAIARPVETNKDLFVPGKAPVTPQATGLAHLESLMKAQPKADEKPANSMRLAATNELHTYNYVFEGQATHKGKPASNASVALRVVTPRSSFLKSVITDSDGRYSMEVKVEGFHFDPVDWAMEAYTADFEKVQLVGRRIIMREDEQDASVNVQNSVDFKSSVVQLPN